MIIQAETIPDGELSKFIESYWESNDDFSLAPEGTFHILFSFSEFVLISGNKHVLGPGLYLIPINSQLIRVLNHSKIIVIRAKAFTMGSILVEEQLYRERKNDYWKFEQSLSILNSFQIKFNLKENLSGYEEDLEELIYELITNRFSLNKTLRERVNYILEKKGIVQIKEMSRDFGTSRQSIHKYFIKHLKISPKQLSNIWRMNHFLDLANNQNSLTVSAIDAGYFDQAHCIKDFKRSFGVSPKSFLSDDSGFTLHCINNRFNKLYDPK